MQYVYTVQCAKHGKSQHMELIFRGAKSKYKGIMVLVFYKGIETQGAACQFSLIQRFNTDLDRPVSIFFFSLSEMLRHNYDYEKKRMNPDHSSTISTTSKTMKKEDLLYMAICTQSFSLIPQPKNPYCQTGKQKQLPKYLYFSFINIFFKKILDSQVKGYMFFSLHFLNRL